MKALEIVSLTVHTQILRLWPDTILAQRPLGLIRSQPEIVITEAAPHEHVQRSRSSFANIFIAVEGGIIQTKHQPHHSDDLLPCIHRVCVLYVRRSS